MATRKVWLWRGQAMPLPQLWPNGSHTLAYVPRMDSSQMPLSVLNKKLLPVASLACSPASDNSAATSLSFCPWTLHLLHPLILDLQLCFSPSPKRTSPRVAKSSQGRMEKRRQASQPDPRGNCPHVECSGLLSPALFADPSFCVIKCIQCPLCIWISCAH